MSRVNPGILTAIVALSAASFQLSASGFQLPAIVSRLSASSSQPPTPSPQSPTSNTQPPTSNTQPPTSNTQPPTSAGFTFTNIAREAGIDMQIVFGGRDKNTYLVETTGTGVAMLDYDGDGWMDLFFVNGSTLEGFPPDAAPTNRLYRNKGNRTFEDVTAKTGLAASGWGQGVCAGDYDNDGRADLLVTYWGQNRLYHNDEGRFTDVTERAGLRTPRKWSTSCAFLDYDRDGRLDLFVANYIDFDPAATPKPESGLCRYRGLPVA
jgi:hypothetical protein